MFAALCYPEPPGAKHVDGTMAAKIPSNFMRKNLIDTKLTWKLKSQNVAFSVKNL